jgi:Serine dehydrogenase proteinase
MVDGDLPSEVRDDPCDWLLVNGDIGQPVLAEVFQVVGELQQVHGDLSKRSITLILTTYGGDPDAAFKIARYLQRTYSSIDCYVPSQCKSAGTLIAIASERLFIGNTGELGPLDAQLRPIDDPFGRRSGLTSATALRELETHCLKTFERIAYGVVQGGGGAVSFSTAARFAWMMTSNLYSDIYGKIDPERLAQDARDLQIVSAYGERLDKTASNLKPDGLKRLIEGYPSHEFVIDIEEARTLFEHVFDPTGQMLDIFVDYADDIVTVKSGSDFLVRRLFVSAQSALG